MKLFSHLLVSKLGSKKAATVIPPEEIENYDKEDLKLMGRFSELDRVIKKESKDESDECFHSSTTVYTTTLSFYKIPADDQKSSGVKNGLKEVFTCTETLSYPSGDKCFDGNP